MPAPVEEIEDALEISCATAPNLRVEDCRRLTGPGLLWDRAGAVMDVFFDGFAPERVAALWHDQARRVLGAIGWEAEATIHRQFEGGLNLALSAPMDRLYSATFAAQTAWHFCAAELLVEAPNPFQPMIDDLIRVMGMEANPALLALAGAARENGLDLMADDEAVSVGYGRGARVWPADALPTPDEVDWTALGEVPVALVTGTNGKTTTTRLTMAIARAAGLVAGLTSTDLVRVGDDILDRGDYSGPGGARLLLRDKRLEFGVLEVARGGILRRGLPIRRARAAVVTNVAADHLGQYGVNTVPELAAAKFAVRRALAKDGVLVLNADDPFVVDEARRTPGPIWWFSLDPASPQITAARAAGTPCAWVEGGKLWFFDGTVAAPQVAVADIPIAMGGAASYNILNALAALCLARALGLGAEAIDEGLRGFHGNAADNPGRCNEYLVKGARIFVDFAHNPHSIAAVTGALSAVPAKRRFVMISHAGDRSDEDIRGLTRGAFALGPDFVVAAELSDYLRGREPGEVTALIRQAALECGLGPAQVLNASSPLDGAQQIVARIGEGDVALLLVHSERDRIFDLLERASS